MCLIIFNWQPDSQKPLILAANRDEFHKRPSLDADYWEDNPDIFGGRDLEKRGTWLGLRKNPDNTSFRMSALTNFRRPDQKKYGHSRGEIPHAFLASSLSAQEYLQQIEYEKYAGFNGLFFDGKELAYCHHESGQKASIQLLKPGKYGLSNAQLDTPWPKVQRTKKAFDDLDCNASNDDLAKHLMTYLRDDQIAEDHVLPNTGVGIEFERMLSAPFIISPEYGTRTATIIIMEARGESTTTFFKERQFSRDGQELREQLKHLS